MPSPGNLHNSSPAVFFSPDGYLSLRSNVPQVPVFHDLAFEHYPQDVKPLEAWHCRKYFPKYAYKARRILTVSGTSSKTSWTVAGRVEQNRGGEQCL